MSWLPKQKWSHFVLILFAAITLGVQGQDDFDLLKDEARDFEVRMGNLWQSYKSAKEAGDKDRMESVFNQFKEIQQRNGGEVFESAALLFLREGYLDLNRLDYLGARAEFLRAADLDPYLWPAYSGLAEIKRKRDDDFQRYIDLSLKGVREAFDLKNAYFFLNAGLWFLRTVVWFWMVALVLMTVFLVFRYVRPFYVSTHAAFDHRGLGPTFSAVLSLFIMLLPLILGLNLMLIAGLYLVLFFPFYQRGEKQVALALLASFLLFPGVLWFMGNMNQARSDQLLRAHLTQYVKPMDSSLIGLLEKNQSDPNFGAQSALSLGRIYKQKGDLDAAEQAYGSIPRGSAYFSHARNNTANIHVMRKEFQQAVDIYKSILERDPGFAAASYNLGVVQAKLGKHRESETQLAIALKKDPELRRKAALGAGVYGEDVLDAGIDTRARLFKSIMGQGLTGTHIGELIIPAGIGLFLLVAAFLHAGARDPRLIAKTCEKCGRVFFQSDSPNSEWCSQCVSLYIKKEDLPSEAKIRKQEEVKRFTLRKRRTAMYAQLFVPGTGAFLRGNVWSGVLMVTVWLIFLVLLFRPFSQIDYVYMAYFSDGSIVPIIIGALALVYWAIFGLRPVWREE